MQSNIITSSNPILCLLELKAIPTFYDLSLSQNECKKLEYDLGSVYVPEISPGFSRSPWASPAVLSEGGAA